MQIPSINPIPLSTRFSTNIYFTDGEDHLSSTHTYISQTNGFSILCAQIRNAHFLGALTLISIRPPYHLWGNANYIDSFIYNLYTNKRDFPWPAAASLCEGNIDGGDYRQKAQLRHRKGLIDCNKFSWLRLAAKWTEFIALYHIQSAANRKELTNANSIGLEDFVINKGAAANGVSGKDSSVL